MHLWMNDVNDGCLVMGEGTIEKISELQVGIEPTTSVTLVGWSNHWATRTPCKIGHLTGFFLTQSVSLALSARQCNFHESHIVEP